MTDALRSQTDSLLPFVGVLDTDGTLRSVNEAAVVAAGFGIDDVRGKKCWNCLWWSDSDDLRQCLREACEHAARGEVGRHEAVVRLAGDARLAMDFRVAPLRDSTGHITHLMFSAVEVTGRVQADAVEEVFTTRAGEARTFLSSKSPLRDAQGRVTGLVGVTRDITDERRSQEALRAREARYRQALESMSEGYAILTPDWTYLFVNKVNAEQAHSRPEDMVGRSMLEVIPGVERSPFFEAYRRCMEERTPQRVESAFTYEDGDLAWFEAVAEPVAEGISVRAQDITERKHREVALADRRRLYKTITDNATLALFIMDSRQQCVFMNPASERLTGFTFEEVQGRPLHDLIHHTRPDGRPYPLEECPIDRALPTRNQEQGEDVFVHKDGHFYPVAFTASPIVENGRPIGTVIEVRDTTQEKEVEQQLRHAVAMRDEFLSIASHELRTPLTALGLQLDRLKKLVAHLTDGDKPKALKNVDTAIRQADRLESLIEALLNVSRMAAGGLQLQMSRFDLRSLVEDAVDRLSALSARAGCEVQMHLRDEATGTWDRERVDAVLTNLLSNALKYAPGKPIDVTVVADFDWVSLSVKDNGIGILPEAQARIFGRFERAVSPNYGGLGLGLYIARQLVEAHGGSIEVQSVPGEGATFTVRLPRKARSTEAPPVAAARDEVRS